MPAGARSQPHCLPAALLWRHLSLLRCSSVRTGASFLPQANMCVQPLLTITVLLHVVSDARQDQAHPPRGYQQPRLFRLRAQVSNAPPAAGRSSKKAVMIQFR